MFGYIRPYESELKVRSLRLYKSLYCGLCKSSKQHISFFSRFFLSYDYVLFASVRMIFEKTPLEYTVKRCGFHLFAKKTVICDNSVLALSSAVFSILTYYKIRDNIKDERFLRSVGARLLLPFASHMRKKALKKGYTDAEAVISDCMERISVLESSSDCCAGDISEVFGDMMGYLLKLGLSDEDKEDAYTAGFEVGSFIYNADAVDDLEKDEKLHRFNPYLNMYGNAENARSEIKKLRNTLVRGTDIAADIISERMKTADKSTKELCELVQNILYLGCPAVIDGILCGGKCRKKRR